MVEILEKGFVARAGAGSQKHCTLLEKIPESNNLILCSVDCAAFLQYAPVCFVDDEAVEFITPPIGFLDVNDCEARPAVVKEYLQLINEISIGGNDGEALALVCKAESEQERDVALATASWQLDQAHSGLIGEDFGADDELILELRVFDATLLQGFAGFLNGNVSDLDILTCCNSSDLAIVTTLRKLMFQIYLLFLGPNLCPDVRVLPENASKLLKSQVLHFVEKEYEFLGRKRDAVLFDLGEEPKEDEVLFADSVDFLHFGAGIRLDL